MTEQMENEVPVAAADAAPNALVPMSRLVIEGDGLRFERSVPDSTVLQVMRLVLGDSIPDPRVADTADRGSVRTPQSRAESLPEYYRRHAPNRIAEKLTVIGRYLTEEAGAQSFSLDDVRQAFRQVRETLPANLTRDVKTAVAQGWLGEDGSGVYYITLTGAAAMDAQFTSETRSRTRRRKRATGRPGTAEPGEESDD